MAESFLRKSAKVFLWVILVIALALFLTSCASYDFAKSPTSENKITDLFSNLTETANQSESDVSDKMTEIQDFDLEQFFRENSITKIDFIQDEHPVNGFSTYALYGELNDDVAVTFSTIIFDNDLGKTYETGVFFRIGLSSLAASVVATTDFSDDGLKASYREGTSVLYLSEDGKIGFTDRDLAAIKYMLNDGRIFSQKQLNPNSSLSGIASDVESCMIYAEKTQ